MFEFGEELFDLVQVWLVFRHEEQPCLWTIPLQHRSIDNARLVPPARQRQREPTDDGSFRHAPKLRGRVRMLPFVNRNNVYFRMQRM